MIKLKNSNCDKTLKNQIVTKTNSNCDITKDFKWYKTKTHFGTNLKTQIVTAQIAKNQKKTRIVTKLKKIN